MINLPIQSLEFEDIKTNFKEFLKGNERYKDFNFEASGISTLLNINAYQTHYIGYFVKMLLDEAFADSAHTRQALMSHAKGKGYVPKGRKSARADLVLAINTTLDAEPASRSISVPRGTTFNSVNNAADNRTFSLLDGTVIYNRTVSGNDVTYTSETLTVHEGEFRTWRFIADSSILNQKYTIRDENIDVDTIRVRVRENSTSTDYREFTLAKDIQDLGPTSAGYFVSTDENENYQVFFGNDVFGIEPKNGNEVEVTFMSCSGLEGDGAKVFTFNRPNTGELSGFTSFDVTTSAASAGGAEPQTVEELRFAIPNNYRRQNRTFTEIDFRSILMDEFRNIDSMNVWGGEDNVIKDYGKVYMSIKPKNADRLTANARQQIRNELVKKYGYVGVDVVFVDPSYVDVDLTVVAKVDLRKTSKSLPEINARVLSRIAEYNANVLSKFDVTLVDVDMLNFIKGSETYFTSLYSVKGLSKTTIHLHGSTSTAAVSFGNALTPGTIESSDIAYASTTARIKDDEKGNLLMVVSGQSIKAGTIDYNTGLIQYFLPQFARITGFESSTSGRLVFKAKPVVPDVATYLNNIVRITDSKVTN